MTFVHREAPKTNFTCDGKKPLGSYADVETNCQSFHVCTGDPEKGSMEKHSFLCPNGTIFNQVHFICDWWYNFDCEGLATRHGLAYKVLN